MTNDKLSRFLFLPELKFLDSYRHAPWGGRYYLEKVSKFEVCPKCASKCTGVYDRRTVRIEDQPIRGKGVTLVITKRRFYCKGCKKPFTEPVPGIRKGFRTTERYRAGLAWACERMTDLKRVRDEYRCSHGMVYKVFYEQLELKRRARVHAWPKSIGIDEHAFKRAQKGSYPEFATMFVDHNHKRVMEVAHGRDGQSLRSALTHIPGRENVKNVTLDMSDP